MIRDKKLINEQIFRCQSVDINYIEGPANGSNILLLHGGCSRWQSFLPIISDLITNFRVYAIDFRGHGKSGRTISYNVQDYVQDTYLFIKEHIKKPTIIFGNSLGGVVAIMTAAYHPELVRAVIIGDAPISMKSFRNLIDSQRDFADQIIKWLRTNQITNIYKKLKDDHFAESLSLCDPDMLVAMFDQFEFTFREYSINELFPLIICPVLVIRGCLERGSLITDSDMNQASKLLTSVSQVQLPNVGHSLMEDKFSVLKEINFFINALNKSLI
ncbi:MAG: alpha/beta hydrolase [Gammaproteobacteria bacterium]|nr:alpha/beta hydrolase [Gammaproteobacteria bacterium]